MHINKHDDEFDDFKRNTLTTTWSPSKMTGNARDTHPNGLAVQNPFSSNEPTLFKSGAPLFKKKLIALKLSGHENFHNPFIKDRFLYPKSIISSFFGQFPRKLPKVRLDEPD